MLKPKTNLMGSTVSVSAQRGKNTRSEAQWKERVLPFAELLDDSEELQNEMQFLDDANKDVKRGAFLVMLDVREILGDKLKDMPVPYSTEKDSDNPDEYAISGTKRKGYFYNDLADSFGGGKKADTLIRVCNLALKDETAGQVPKEYYEKKGSPLYGILDNEEAVKQLKRNAESTRTYYRGLVYDAIALHFQLERLSKMKFILVQTKPVEVKTNKPFIIRSADTVNEPGAWKEYGVQQVLSMDVEAAMANGGTFEALKKTLRREKKGEEREPLKVTDAGKELAYVNGLMLTIAGDTTTAGYGDFIKRLHEDQALRVETFRLYNALDTFCSKEDLATKYARDEQELAAGSEDGEEAEAA